VQVQVQVRVVQVLELELVRGFKSMVEWANAPFPIQSVIREMRPN
jgi:hypothetical protein